jgi:hypothetical protein
MYERVIMVLVYQPPTGRRSLSRPPKFLYETEQNNTEQNRKSNTTARPEKRSISCLDDDKGYNPRSISTVPKVERFISIYSGYSISKPLSALQDG